LEIVKKNFLDLINLKSPDILISIWELSLLKRDLSVQFPTIFDFITNAYSDEATKGTDVRSNLEKFMRIRDEVFAEIFSHADYFLFREDVDPKAAIEIILYVMQGFAQNIVDFKRENYDAHLQDFEKILDILRLVFYR
ncbi:MAG: hypothetical protein FWD19_04995, partial [Defluviitaleaceae bacterium]|nr:hypothetical protein [Defluviitaleaceae bacterium]